MRAMANMTKNVSTGAAGLDVTVSVEIKPIPFRTELSLAPLFAFWARTFGDDKSLEGTFARTIREATEAAPELLAPMTDPSVIDRHRKFVDVLMAAVDRKSTRLNSSHTVISYAVFCLKKKKKTHK